MLEASNSTDSHIVAIFYSTDRLLFYRDVVEGHVLIYIYSGMLRSIWSWGVVLYQRILPESNVKNYHW